MNNWMRRCMLLAFLSPAAQAAMVETAIDYNIDGQAYRGYAIYDQAVHSKRPRPVLLLVPNWLGTTPANREQAAQVAGKDYVVFVADMFGKDRQPADMKAAGAATAALYADRAELRKRVLAAKTEATRYASTAGVPADAQRIAAIGFCFGGASVLELARTGEPLAAVVSLHGNLSLDGPANNQPLRTRILALHGDADPVVPPAQVEAFEREMRAAQADWQLVRYGGAVHSFTDPAANRPGQSMYNPKAARRAFATMRDFLKEAFE